MEGKKGNLKTLKISEELHAFLDKNGNRGETFEEVIWRLILGDNLSDKNKKLIKEASNKN